MKKENKIYGYLNKSVDDIKFSDISSNVNYGKYNKKKVVFPRKFILIVGSLLLIVSTIFVINSFRNDSPEINDYVLVKASNRVDVDSLGLNGNKEYQDFIKKIQVFSAKLSVAVYEDSDKTSNLCVSPISVYMALAMTITNSSGIAKEELLNAIGVTEEEVNNFTKYLYSYLKLEKYKKDDYTKEEKICSILDLNNSIWIDENVSLKQDGLDNLANNFMADSFYAPFNSNNVLANQLMSDYVDEKTRGLIKPELQLSTDTIFALVNTLYMKDFWYGSKDKINYSKEKYDFTTSSGDIISDYFLESIYNAGRVYETESYSEFYVSTDSGYRLKIFVPQDGYSLNDVFTVDNLIDVNNVTDFNAYEYNEFESITHLTRTIFPKFEASYDDDLIPIFKEDFNVNSIFESGKHMTGMTDIELFISSIIHKTKLKVDETGIEGAAVTIMAFEDESVENFVYHDFVVDKAFGYLITDKYGNILFTGVINDI